MVSAQQRQPRCSGPATQCSARFSGRAAPATPHIVVSLLVQTTGKFCGHPSVYSWSGATAAGELRCMHCGSTKCWTSLRPCARQTRWGALNSSRRGPTSASVRNTSCSRSCLTSPTSNVLCYFAHRLMPIFLAHTPTYLRTLSRTGADTTKPFERLSIFATKRRICATGNSTSHSSDRCFW